MSFSSPISSSYLKKRASSGGDGIIDGDCSSTSLKRYKKTDDEDKDGAEDDVHHVEEENNFTDHVVEDDSSDEEIEENFPDVNDRAGDKAPSWINVPTQVWYRVKATRIVKTTFGKRMLVTLAAPKRPSLEVFATELVAKSIRLRECTKNEGEALYIMSLGLRPSERNKGQSYCDFIIKSQ